MSANVRTSLRQGSTVFRPRADPSGERGCWWAGLAGGVGWGDEEPHAFRGEADAAIVRPGVVLASVAYADTAALATPSRHRTLATSFPRPSSALRAAKCAWRCRTRRRRRAGGRAGLRRLSGRRRIGPWRRRAAPTWSRPSRPACPGRRRGPPTQGRATERLGCSRSSHCRVRAPDRAAQVPGAGRPGRYPHHRRTTSGRQGKKSTGVDCVASRVATGSSAGYFLVARPPTPRRVRPRALHRIRDRPHLQRSTFHISRSLSASADPLPQADPPVADSRRQLWVSSESSRCLPLPRFGIGIGIGSASDSQSDRDPDPDWACSRGTQCRVRFPPA